MNHHRYTLVARKTASAYEAFEAKLDKETANMEDRDKTEHKKAIMKTMHELMDGQLELDPNNDQCSISVISANISASNINVILV